MTPTKIPELNPTLAKISEPAESSSGLFGGNSNWHGPVWFPVNYLLIESLQKFHHYWGDDFKVECPTGSGRWLTLWEVSTLLSQRLTSIFTRNAQQKRPVYGGSTSKISSFFMSTSMAITALGLGQAIKLVGLAWWRN